MSITINVVRLRPFRVVSSVLRMDANGSTSRTLRIALQEELGAVSVAALSDGNADHAEFAAQVSAARQWIARAPWADRTMRRFSSYRIKHIIRQDDGVRVSNGAVFVAALLEGYTLVRAKRSGRDVRFTKID